MKDASPTIPASVFQRFSEDDSPFSLYKAFLHPVLKIAQRHIPAIRLGSFHEPGIATRGTGLPASNSHKTCRDRRLLPISVGEAQGFLAFIRKLSAFQVH
jgi:hypothetical protein